jgi:tetraacyldisaccharide 4'-kinase
LLREPVGSLRRASVVVLSRADLVDPAARQLIRVQAEKAAGPLRWVLARHAPLDLIDAELGSFSLETLPGQKVAAFCGIGNPEGFRRTLNGLGMNLVGFRAFPDHHAYSSSDVADLSAWLKAQGADLALTTQKDLVKLRTLSLGPVPLHALRIGLEVMEGRNLLEEALEALLPSGKDAP